MLFSLIWPCLTILQADSSRRNAQSRFLTGAKHYRAGQNGIQVRRDLEQKQTKKVKAEEAANHCKTNFSQGRAERGLLQLGDVGNRSKSGQINDLATTVQTDLNHNSWCRRGRTSVLCSVPTAVQQEPRDSALGCTYTGKKNQKN